MTQTAEICDENELDMQVRTVLHTKDKHPSFSTKKEYRYKISLTKLPVTRHMSLEKLQEFVNDFEIGDELLFHFANHTQVVERSVKLVTQTAEICDAYKLDIQVRTVLHTRGKHLSFSIKKEYRYKISLTELPITRHMSLEELQ